MKVLFFSLTLLLCTTSIITAQDFYLPLSTTDRGAVNAYHGATYLGANLRMDHARAEIESALEIDPNFFMAYAYTYQVLAEDAEKSSLLEKALAIVPTNFTEAEKIMRQLLESWAKDPKASPTEAMKDLVAAYPNTAEAYELAYLHAAYTEQNMEAALAYAQKLIELDPNYGPVYNFMGYYYLGTKEMDKAKAAFEKYLELNAMEGNAYDSMGDYYMITGDYAKSAEFYEQAVELGMENSQARADKARAMIKE